VGREIIDAQVAAGLAHRVGDRARNLAAIEGVASAAGDPFERRGQSGVLKRLAVPRRIAAGEKGLLEAGKLASLGQPRAPRAGDHLGHGETIAGRRDRRGEHTLQRQLAEPAVQLGPTVDAPGNAHRERADLRDALDAQPLEFLERQPARAAAAGVQAVEFFPLGVPDDGKQIAADAAAGRFGHAQHRVGGDRGVDGRAAGLQRLDRRERGERLARGGHAVLADRRRAGDKRAASGPIGGECGRREHGEPKRRKRGTTAAVRGDHRTSQCGVLNEER
jgi:hypothetical protein